MRDADSTSPIPPFGVACAVALATGVVMAMQQAKLTALWISVPLCAVGLGGWSALRRWKPFQNRFPAASLPVL